MLVNMALTARAASPQINFQPKDQTVILYQQAAFGVIASGTPALSYQWHKDGMPIAEGTNDQIVLAHPQFSDAERMIIHGVLVKSYAKSPGFLPPELGEG